MARPKKNTVDYFPHDCHWDKKLEIFVTKHGNSGYSFYYRLLELLGITEGHKYDCNETIDKQYLATKTGVSEENMNEYLESLVSLDVIDKECWKTGNIWVQSFVDSVSEVYEKRTSLLPTKESNGPENYTSEGFTTRKPEFSRGNRGFRGENSQSKVKETKLNKGEERNGSHTQINFQTLKEKFPTIDVDKSYERFVTNNSASGNTHANEAAAFELWLGNDVKYNRNLKRPESTKVMKEIICANCYSSKQVSQKEILKGSILCDKCDDEVMVEKYELPYEKERRIKGN